MKILLIEPDRALAETYQKALVAAGHNVTVTAGAQAAVLAADQQTPDLVVLEIQLVEHSGIEFLYEFRSYPEWQGIPVVVQTMVPVSEFGSSEAILRDELGVSVYLYKPRVSLRDLISRIAQFDTVKA